MRRKSLFQIRYSSRSFLIGYVTIVLIALLILFFFYSNTIAKKLEKDSEKMTRSMVELAAYLPSIDDYKLSLMVRKIVREMRINNNKLSFVITDASTNEPIVVRGVDPEIERKVEENEELRPDERRKLQKVIREMDSSREPITTQYVSEDRNIVGYMYYGDVAANMVDRIPFVFTDVSGSPLFWRIWDEFQTYETSPAGIDRAKAFVKDALQHDRKVAIQISPSYREGNFHYSIGGYTALLFMPLIEMVLLLGFLSVGFWIYRGAKMSEQAAVWGGLARETAHQLGTPISSLMGWAEVLEDKLGNDPDSRQILDEMEEDLERLRRVTARFGEIGSSPKMEPMRISDVIHQAVEYYRKRISFRKKRVEIREHYAQDIPFAMVNDVLLSWVIENLIKNSLDAFDKDESIIDIRTDFDPKSGEIVICYSDNGKGISRKDRAKIFQPGYTTKKHGWGLGLPLIKRIVEEYHGGTLSLVDTGPGGTTFQIRLPASEA